MKRLFLIFPLLVVLFTGCYDSNERGMAGNNSPAGLSPQRIEQDAASGRESFTSSLRRKKQQNRKIHPGIPGSMGSPDNGRSRQEQITERIAALRSMGIDPDWNEPATRDYILSGIDAGRYVSMVTLSRERFLKINFDNDIFDNTDRFYTNGIRFDLIAPLLARSPLSRLMVPYWGSGTNHYGISLVQNLYTPYTTKLPGIQYGDRPFAAYLYFSTFKITSDPGHRIRQTSELALGVIGPLACGDFIQKKFHSVVIDNSEPGGWDYQVENDLVVNYNYTVEKGLAGSDHFDIHIVGEGALGTLYTNIGGGFHLRAGILNPYFSNLGVSAHATNRALNLRDIQVAFFLKSTGKIIGYDATLQGGLFNQTSPYTVPASAVARVTLHTSAGLTFVYRGFRIDLEQLLLSPEMKNGYWHKWVHIGLTFCL